MKGEEADASSSWSVQRSLPQLERVKRVRKSVSMLSPDPSVKDYSIANAVAARAASSPLARGRRGSAAGVGTCVQPATLGCPLCHSSCHTALCGTWLTPKPSSFHPSLIRALFVGLQSVPLPHVEEESSDEEWDWLCVICLAQNLDSSAVCRDCGERRGCKAEDVACQADGGGCAHGSNAPFVPPFRFSQRTAVGYDHRMLWHCQASQSTDHRLIDRDHTAQSALGQVHDAVAHLCAEVEACAKLEGDGSAGAGGAGSGGLRFGLSLAAELRTKLSKHPERPDRAKAAYRRLEALQLLEDAVLVEGREATEAELVLAHEATHVKSVLAADGALDEMNDCYRNTDTPLAAKVAVGTTVDVTRAVLRGEASNGVAIVRPPGHHACPCKAAGFCFFNNTAVAAAVAKREFGLERILIVDWDGAPPIEPNVYALWLSGGYGYCRSHSSRAYQMRF
eukprot:SAG11_NODE_4176_length_2027_cov_1.162344_1_plen_451_part_00